MRVMSIIMAAVVCVAIYLFVFERGALLDFAGRPAGPAEAAAAAETEAAETTSAQASRAASPDRVSVVALRSTAEEIRNAVTVRGRTEAARQVDVQSETSGRVVSDPIRKGTFVEAGDLLCEIDPGTRQVARDEAEARLDEARANLPSAEASVIEAEARLAEAEINDRAASRLSESGFAADTRVASTKAGVEAARAGVQSAASGVSSAQAAIRSAEAAVASAERELERLKILAPFAGLMETDGAELGALLQPGSLCATIIDLDPIKLVGFVPETSVAEVETGAEAGARLASGDTVQGRVTFLSRSADEETRTFRVEVTVPNPDFRIRDGETVELLIGTEGERAHFLPTSALTLDDDGQLGVRTVEGGDDDAAAGFSPVQILRDTADGIWVAGLPETVEVIVVGQEFVTEGVPIAVTYRGDAG